MSAFEEYTNNSNNILVITSQPIDQDCISSGLIMKRYLEYLGKNVRMLFPRELLQEEKDYNAYLPFFEEFTSRDTRPDLEKGDFDTLILLDGTNWEQFYDYKNTSLPMPKLDKCKKIIQIDHHLGNPEDLATFQIKNSKASSTVEVILTEVVPIDFIDTKLATLAYAGLVGDTGNFRWNFNPGTLKIAGLLLERGAEPSATLDKLFFSKTKDYLKMLSYAIDNTEYDDELHAQFLCLSSDKKKSDGITEDEADTAKRAFHNEISRSVQGYSIGFVINQDLNTGIVHIGARGNNLTNEVNLPIMLSMMGGNGGGHFNAAGMDCSGDFEEIVKVLKNTLTLQLKQTQTP